jgi:oxygen-independent coproporphyrinogen-3 oxidase
MLMQAMYENGYDHYEISNFAKPGFYAVHNAAYWQGEHYLGIGPAAHSFDGQSRQWNIANNALYIKAVESLSRNEGTTKPLIRKRNAHPVAQQYNEYVMTGLRTIWGCSEEKVDKFGESLNKTFSEKSANHTWPSGQMTFKAGNYHPHQQRKTPGRPNRLRTFFPGPVTTEFI